MTHKHTITLHGGGASKERISAHLFRDLLDLLVDGAEKSLRYRIEGRSTVGGGRYPRSLRPAADFVLVRGAGHEANSAVIEARPLIETMPERFHQGDMFDDLDPSKSPVDLFEDALEDALAGNEDSDLFDGGLVRAFQGFSALLDQGVERVEMVNGRTLRVDGHSMLNIQRLAGRTYAPQRVRVAGRLETIRYSDCRFVLTLADGASMGGTAIDLGNEVLRESFGRTVMVTGRAVFRPSGRPLRIDAEKIEAASDRDALIWSSPPKPLLPSFAPKAIREEQRSKGGLSAVFGKWPGDESDEEVQAALDSLS